VTQIAKAWERRDLKGDTGKRKELKRKRMGEMERDQR